MQADGACRSCKAPVRWVLVAGSNRRMPLDPTPSPNGNVWVTEWLAHTPVVSVVANPDAVPSNVPTRYTSHFVTCPDAKEWRKEHHD